MNIQKANEKSFFGKKQYDFQKRISVSFNKRILKSGSAVHKTNTLDH